MKAINFSLSNIRVAVMIIAAALFSNQLFPQVQPATSNFQNEFAITSKLIVMLKTDRNGIEEFGAGIIFGREKNRLLIVTANHIVSSATHSSNIQVQFRGMPKDKYVMAKLLRNDKEGNLDIAVLGVEAPLPQGIEICALPFDRLGKVNNLQWGKLVYPVGNPKGVSWASPVTGDRVSEITDVEIVFQSNFISSGHSGGRLLNSSGKLVGEH